MVWISFLTSRNCTRIISCASKSSRISTIYSRSEEKVILDGVAKQLQLNQMSDWYKLQAKVKLLLKYSLVKGLSRQSRR